MKQLFITFTTVLLLLIAFVACNNEKEEYFDEPIDVPFTVFSMTNPAYPSNLLLGTSCRWLEFRGNFGRNEVVVINNDRDLRRHITCVEDSDLPVINFSKYTLLLVRGATYNVVFPRSVNLQQLSSRSYVINVCITTTGLTAVTFWHVAIVTDKLDENARFRLKITH